MSAFEQHCREIVDEYVQTVLIIDDGAGLKPSFESAEHIDMTDLGVFDDSNDSDDSDDSDDSGQVTHALDTLHLTNAFYDLGIVAGLYQPQIDPSQSADEFAQKIRKVASTADIIILDWMLTNHDSSYSKAIVKQILDQDKESGGRLRTIVIYTGETSLHNKRDELWEYLDDQSLDNSEEYRIFSEHLNIVFYNKEGSNNHSREVAEHKLPTKALEEFALLVNGLVPSFAMKASAAIRYNTGRIITRFGKELDSAYLSHRVLVQDPEDSELFMLENFISYMRNILAIGRIDNIALGSSSIKSWVTHNLPYLSKKIVHNGNEYTLEPEELIKLSQEGFHINLYDLLKDKNSTMASAFKDTSKEASLKAISIYDTKENTAQESSRKLSILSAFKRTFFDVTDVNEIPYLTQGTLIYSKNNDKFLLCVTPKCDTVRINKSKRFSFAVLEEVNGKKFDMVVPINNAIKLHKKSIYKNKQDEIRYLIIEDAIINGGKAKDSSLHEELSKLTNQVYNDFVYLATSSKFYALEHIVFECDENRRVLGSRPDSDWIEFWDQDCQEYIWLGDLHDLNTISRVGKLVTNLNRTGLDELEWLRRQYQ
ncbi:hypothetical protein IDG76_11670 [Vibrio cholerae]|nr:response regulator receiver domain [Vibrio cholerae]MBD1177213.1 hypothetical protein [Vibrio cholerae]